MKVVYLETELYYAQSGPEVEMAIGNSPAQMCTFKRESCQLPFILLAPIERNLIPFLSKLPL